MDSPTTAEQDYLKTIYALQQEKGRAATQALASRLSVTPASVTAMVKRLADDPKGPYVRHTPYHGVQLTPRGEAIALEMVRHHRLLELFLAEYLGMPWDHVHSEAERLEHVISEELEERIALKLGQPKRDPHGDPIPTRDGRIEESNDIALAVLPIGVSTTVARVPSEKGDLLQYLASLGLVPGVSIMITEIAPYGDVMTLRIGSEPHAIGGNLAQGIFVHHPEEG